jgi:FtsH-binding integral membrane protein
MPQSTKTFLFPSLNEDPTHWSSPAERNAFVASVYKIFITSLLLSAATAYLGVKLELGFSLWWILLELAVFFICIIAERNRFLLYLWTSISGFTSAPILSKIIDQGHQNIIWQAILITALLFTILSLYVYYGKKNFSHWRATLVTFLVLGLLAIPLLMIFPNETALILWSVFGIFLFSCCVLYDTSNILNRYEPGDEVMAAVDLHLDFVNLFWDFLRLFRNSSRTTVTDGDGLTDSVLSSDVDVTDLLDD